ncbi:bomanin-836 [Drosophila grimshawi]|uniref:GH21664 n=1 Tax=Drosophila grimshawi TaxID=7222 RepID=B4J5S4_DROGR|nr:bomanin-836 [Drosophila grimshawi]EDW01850.1 GH21664 [Drosophila grimshawi]
MKTTALILLLLGCLLAVVCATPGSVVINGQCIDCNRPDGDDSVIIPGDIKKSAAATQSLTAGSVLFGLLYFTTSYVLRN